MPQAGGISQFYPNNLTSPGWFPVKAASFSVVQVNNLYGVNGLLMHPVSLII